ncbi:MAG TPA: hydantoinase B/oxoprolinase family protein, partial [Acidobacteriota bacterium]|nr:hydantoinase B/oxoprolinase family protein [Acidobacteriota bacterium]
MSEIHPIQIEIYRNLFASIAEEMGTVLKRTSYSPNIKERRDYSCALFDHKGDVIAMGAHMPVHLGSMPLSVKAALDAFPLNPGDVVILNDPFAGGTHLPDITMIAPVFSPSAGDDPIFFVASRAHHSDVGGMVPGSMPLSQEIFQEGVRIPPLKLYESGLLNRGMLSLLLFNVRTPLEREGDLAAQVGSLRVGDRRLLELLERNGLEEVQNSIEALHLYAERTMRHVISSIPDGVYQAEDFLDDDGIETASSIRLKVSLEVVGDQLSIDFS